ncbi:reverse transcriptase domain-containing protein [Tanacetum coccineum]
MTTTLNEGKVSSGSLPVCERCFTRHVGQCTIKCHKRRKIGHKARYCKEKNVATGANAQPIWTCYDCGEQGHTRNRCPKKVKQEEVGESRGRAYAIKDAESQGPNVVMGTFLLNNRYASILFYFGSDRSFVDTRFSSMLDIDPVKIDTSYEVELADGRIVSTNTVLKGCTLNLVNHLFEINLMPIELGTHAGCDLVCSDVHDSVWIEIFCQHDVVTFMERGYCSFIPLWKQTLTVKSDIGQASLTWHSSVRCIQKSSMHSALSLATLLPPLLRILWSLAIHRTFNHLLLGFSSEVLTSIIHETLSVYAAWPARPWRGFHYLIFQLLHSLLGHKLLYHHKLKCHSMTLLDQHFLALRDGHLECSHHVIALPTK